MIYRNIASLLEGQEPVTIEAGATTLDAARRMAERRVGAVAVLDAGRLVGIFTERDLLNRVVSQGLAPESVAVTQAMTPAPRTITDDRSLNAGLDLMMENGFRHLPVLNASGTLVGMLSCRDVPVAYQALRERWKALNREREALASSAAQRAGARAEVAHA